MVEYGAINSWLLTGSTVSSGYSLRLVRNCYGNRAGNQSLGLAEGSGKEKKGWSGVKEWAGTDKPWGSDAFFPLLNCRYYLGQESIFELNIYIQFLVFFYCFFPVLVHILVHLCNELQCNTFMLFLNLALYVFNSLQVTFKNIAALSDCKCKTYFFKTADNMQRKWKVALEILKGILKDFFLCKYKYILRKIDNTIQFSI